jgi:putative ABC transport system permease protein
VKIRDLTELAVRNLRESILRNSLTTLGIAVGVASLVAMLSLGVGLQNLASQRLSRSGLFNAILVSSRANFGEFGGGRGRGGNPSEAGNSHPLDDEVRQRLGRIPKVVEVYSDIRFPTEIQFEGKPYSTIVGGVPAADKTGGDFDGMTGAFFSGPTADETILQGDFAKQLADDTNSLIGKSITLRYAERQAIPAQPGSSDGGSAGFSIIPREKSLRIVGIVETQPGAGFGGGFGQARVLIPMDVAETLNTAQANDLRDLVRATPAKRTYQTLTVRVDGPSSVQSVEDAIKQMGYGAFSLLDATRNLRLVFAVFDLLLGLFGSLALVVSSLGIINTLVMAILERRREIGVLKALGAADRDVRSLFFVEAGTMGFVGGAFGVFIGWLIGRGMTFGTDVYLRRQSLPVIDIASVPWWLVAGAIGFSVVVSLVAGLYPASRAAKLDPVQALRYE